MSLFFPASATSTKTKKDFEAFWQQLGEYLPLPELTITAAPQSIEMPTLEAPLLHSLKKLLSPDRVISTSAERYAYAGGQTYTGFLHKQNKEYMPHAVVLPQNESEIAALMLWASQREIHVLPWGSGTAPYYSKTQTDVPFLVIDMQQLNRLLEIDTQRAQLQVQSGTHWEVIERELEPTAMTTGQLFPSQNATVGGHVATNAVGVKALGYGTLLDNVIQIRAITPSGPIEISRPMPGKADSRVLMLGSYGTWGIITKVTVRLFPAPLEKISLQIGFTSWAEAIKTLQKLLREDYKPTAACIIGNKERRLFSTTNLHGWRQLIPAVRTTPNLWEAYLCLEIEGKHATVNLIRQQIEKTIQDTEANIEINKRPTLNGYGLWTQRQDWLQELWRRKILAHTITASVPWADLPDFIQDWEEALSSIIHATSNYAGLPLTKVYATQDYALIETLLIGHQSPGSTEAQENQLKSIQAVALETKRRWGIDSNTSTLMTLAITAAHEKLDPNGIMLR